MGPVKTKGLDVVENHVPLSRLVEHEFYNLRPVLARPPLCDFRQTFHAHATLLLLDIQVLIRGRADHKLHLAVQFGLHRRAQRDWKPGSGRRFGRRLMLVHRSRYEFGHISGLQTRQPLEMPEY